ncbi:hypothetical protein ACFWWT_04215 [Streptomyces sp. NPDC058676]
MNSLPEPHGWPGVIVAAWPLIAAATLAAVIAVHALRNRIRR